MVHPLGVPAALWSSGMIMEPEYVIVVSEKDPVAQQISEKWGNLPSLGLKVDGTSLRRLSDRAAVLRRSRLHVHDERLDRHLPAPLRERHVPLVFASIHRSGSETGCVTVHPIGNLLPHAELGGEPRQLPPTAPRLMADALRKMHEAATAAGTFATYEATHHGPALDLPAFFVEIGEGLPESTRTELAPRVAALLGDLTPDPSDHVALGVGGGHYVPHFTELSLRRRWAFGHLIPRHALPNLTGDVIWSAWTGTPGAAGVLFQRAADADDPEWYAVGLRLRDSDAPTRSPRGASRASGT
jgi:D-tyrosyl-tRNA(Tyr) deacylase